MSCKDVLLICLIVAGLVIVSLGGSFFRSVVFIAERIIAVAVAYTPGFLHFISTLVR